MHAKSSEKKQLTERLADYTANTDNEPAAECARLCMDGKDGVAYTYVR